MRVSAFGRAAADALTGPQCPNCSPRSSARRRGDRRRARFSSAGGVRVGAVKEMRRCCCAAAALLLRCDRGAPAALLARAGAERGGTSTSPPHAHAPTQTIDYLLRVAIQSGAHGGLGPRDLQPQAIVAWRIQCAVSRRRRVDSVDRLRLRLARAKETLTLASQFGCHNGGLRMCIALIAPASQPSIYICIFSCTPPTLADTRNKPSSWPFHNGVLYKSRPVSRGFA